MSNPQQPGQYGPGGGQPFNQGPGTPPGGQPQPQFGQPGAPVPPPGAPVPPPGQPYGQQTPPSGFGGQQPPPPVGQPVQPGMVPPPPKSGSKLPKIIGLIVVLLIIGGGAFYFFNKSAASASVGDCILVKDDSATDADVEKIDCSKPEAVFKVAKKLDSTAADCPKEGDYLEYEQSGRGSGFSLCLMVNAKEGECLTDVRDADKAKKVACTDPSAKFEVLKVVDGQSDADACKGVEGVDDGFIYTEPKQVICGKTKG